jgi:tripartite-type tricarboxylate transporter receptor subunit TctC
MIPKFFAKEIIASLLTPLLLVLSLTLTTLPSEAVGAPAYPSRTIRVATPFAAGAASDIALRILAEKLSARLGVPVVVQNQPGGGGITSGRTVTNAPADGYT